MSKIFNYYGFLLFFILYLPTIIGQNIDNGRVTVNSTGVRLSPLATVSSDPKDVHFNLYSDPSHPDDFQEIVIGDINSLERSGLVPGRITILLPGFSEDKQFLLLKNEYLSQGAKNIVFVDAGGLNQPELPLPFGFGSYFQALRNVPKIGKKGAAFINFLVQNKKLKNADDFHLVGFSLGTHEAASIGRYLQERYGMTVGRITGLDVAGPFSKKLGKNKFNKKYGKFVDSIHSDIDGFGTPESLGHADFFLNGGKGKEQVDCHYNKDPFTVILCAHPVAFLLYGKTVTKEKEYIGCTCGNMTAASLLFKEVCVEKAGKCENPTQVGENCPTRARGNYYVKVTEKVGVYKELLNEVLS